MSASGRIPFLSLCMWENMRYSCKRESAEIKSVDTDIKNASKGDEDALLALVKVVLCKLDSLYNSVNSLSLIIHL